MSTEQQSEETREFSAIDPKLAGGVKRLISEGMMEDKSDEWLLQLILDSHRASEPQKQWMRSVLARNGKKWKPEDTE